MANKNSTNLELLQKTVSGVLARIESELKKGDVQISPAGPNGDLAEQTGHADGEQLQRADDGNADAKPAPSKQDDGKGFDGAPGTVGQDDDKDKDPVGQGGHEEPDGDEGRGGEGDRDSDEAMKAEGEVLEMLKGLIDQNPDLLKGALFAILDEAGFFDEETPPADQGLAKTEEVLGGINGTVETLSKSLNDFISATNDRLVSLSAQVEALAQRPVGPRRSVTTQQVQPLMKGDTVGEAIRENPLEGLSKSEVTERLLALQREGAIRGYDVQMFATADTLTEAAKLALSRK